MPWVNLFINCCYDLEKLTVEMLQFQMFAYDIMKLCY